MDEQRGLCRIYCVQFRYFIIRIDKEAKEIVADHYSNAINEKGLAVDDETGEVIGCRSGGAVRLPRRMFRGRTAKEISVRIMEEPLHAPQGGENEPVKQPRQPQALPWISRLEHANYLVGSHGRVPGFLCIGGATR